MGWTHIPDMDTNTSNSDDNPFASPKVQAKAKTLEHLSDFVFVSMANLTLIRWDSYLSHVRSGIKTDTLAALRTAPCNLPPS